MNVNQCQDCGNSPTRRCYNAVVCNACCTFFYRCVVSDPPNPCMDSNNCVMIPGSRKNCSYCRFQRCLSLKMAVDKVAKIKRYKSTLQVHRIPQQTMVAMVKQYHPLLISRDHTLSALSIDSLLMWHKFVSNTLALLILSLNPSLTSQITILMTTVVKLFPTLISLLVLIISMSSAFRTRLAKSLIMLDKLYSTVIYPLYVELDFDEMECTAGQAITMYSSAVELSDGGMKKVICARDAFTLKLMEYIENTRPELTRHQQLNRLSKLLSIVNEVREVSRLCRGLFTEMVMNNYGGMDGRITCDIYVNSKE